MKEVLAASAVTLLVLTSMAFAGTRPDYGCQKQYQACIKGCDDAADTSKNARDYQECTDGCEKALTSCTERQEQTDACADDFQLCIKHAHGDSDMEDCRKGYRACKGTH